MSDSRTAFDADRPLPGWDDGRDRPPPWRDAGSTVTFENPWLRMTRHDATAPTGVKADYVVMRPRNLSVGVLPVHGDGTVTLVGQQRFTLATALRAYHMAREGELPPELAKAMLAGV